MRLLSGNKRGSTAFCPCYASSQKTQLLRSTTSTRIRLGLLSGYYADYLDENAQNGP